MQPVEFTQPVVLMDTDEVFAALNNMGLTAEIFHEAEKAGYVAISNCTNHDAPFFPPILRWNEVQKTLRNLLVPQGWHISNDGMFCVVIHPERKFQIAVATGQENTALSIDDIPSTKSAKGVTHEIAVQINIQLKLNLGDARIPLKRNDLLTYYLLFHQTVTEIRSELCLPISIENGHINDYVQRIILPPVILDTIATVTPELGPEIDIDISRKQ